MEDCIGLLRLFLYIMQQAAFDRSPRYKIIKILRSANYTAYVLYNTLMNICIAFYYVFLYLFAGV